MLGEADRRGLEARIGALAAAFAAAGHRFFIVGGMVRDLLLGGGGAREMGGDIDVTTDALPHVIFELLEAWGDTVWDQGRLFGTIGARRESVTVEVTTHRAESYESDSRKPSVSFSEDIEIDLSRRDFTVNAMALEVPGWTLLDPFGGRADLAAGVLRTPSEPRGLFSDDPLRMLRAARFSAQLGLRPTDELIRAAEAMRDRLEIVSRERIAAELTKLVSLERPSVGIEFAHRTGLLAAVLGCWPEGGEPDGFGWLDDLGELSGSQDDSLGDVGDAAALRWAMLLGAACDAAAVSRCLSGLRFDGDTVDRVKAIVRAAHAIRDALGRDGGAEQEADRWLPAVRRLVADHLFDLDAALLALRAWNDTPPASAVERLQEIRATEGAALRTLPIDGHAVMEALGQQGPVVGEALAYLRSAQLVHGPLDETGARALLDAWAR